MGHVINFAKTLASFTADFSGSTINSLFPKSTDGLSNTLYDMKSIPESFRQGFVGSRAGYKRFERYHESFDKFVGDDDDNDNSFSSFVDNMTDGTQQSGRLSDDSGSDRVASAIKSGNNQAMFFNKQNALEQINAIRSTNLSVNNLLTFHLKYTTSYYQQSLAYQKSSFETLTAINEKIDLLSSSKRSPKKDNYDDEVWLDSNGNYKIGKILSKSAKSIGEFLEFAVSSSKSMMTKEMAPSVLSDVVLSFFPGVKKTFNEFDNKINKIYSKSLKALIQKNGSMKDILSFLGIKLPGLDSDPSKYNSGRNSLNLSGYRTMDIDIQAENKKRLAITDVIPAYLRTITEKLTGVNMIFDYNSGRFVSTSEMRKKSEEIRQYYSSDATKDNVMRFNISARKLASDNNYEPEDLNSLYEDIQTINACACMHIELDPLKDSYNKAKRYLPKDSRGRAIISEASYIQVQQIMNTMSSAQKDEYESNRRRDAETWQERQKTAAELIHDYGGTTAESMISISDWATDKYGKIILSADGIPISKEAYKLARNRQRLLKSSNLNKTNMSRYAVDDDYDTEYNAEKEKLKKEHPDKYKEMYHDDNNVPIYEKLDRTMKHFETKTDDIISSIKELPIFGEKLSDSLSGPIKSLATSLSKYSGKVNSKLTDINLEADKKIKGSINNFINDHIPDSHQYVTDINTYLDNMINENEDGGRGSSVYFNQNDPRWANKKFGKYRGHDDTIGSGGCGPTVGAMMLNKLVNGRGGELISPDELSKLAVSRGYKSDGTKPDFFNFIAQKYGTGVSYEKNKSITSISGPIAKKMMTALDNGMPIIIEGTYNGRKQHDSPFKNTIHYVMIDSYTKKSNSVFVHILDPENSMNNRYFDLNQIKDDIKLILTPVNNQSQSIDLNKYNIDPINKLWSSNNDLFAGAEDIINSNPIDEINVAPEMYNLGAQQQRGSGSNKKVGYISSAIMSTLLTSSPIPGLVGAFMMNKKGNNSQSDFKDKLKTTVNNAKTFLFGKSEEELAEEKKSLNNGSKEKKKPIGYISSAIVSTLLTSSPIPGLVAAYASHGSLDNDGGLFGFIKSKAADFKHRIMGDVVEIKDADGKVKTTKAKPLGYVASAIGSTLITGTPIPGLVAAYASHKASKDKDGLLGVVKNTVTSFKNRLLGIPTEITDEEGNKTTVKEKPLGYVSSAVLSTLVTGSPLAGLMAAYVSHRMGGSESIFSKMFGGVKKLFSGVKNKIGGIFGLSNNENESSTNKTTDNKKKSKFNKLKSRLKQWYNGAASGNKTLADRLEKEAIENAESEEDLKQVQESASLVHDTNDTSGFESKDEKKESIFSKLFKFVGSGLGSLLTTIAPIAAGVALITNAFGARDFAAKVLGGLGKSVGLFGSTDVKAYDLDETNMASSANKTKNIINTGASYLIGSGLGGLGGGLTAAGITSLGVQADRTIQNFKNNDVANGVGSALKTTSQVPKIVAHLAKILPKIGRHIAKMPFVGKIAVRLADWLALKGSEIAAKVGAKLGAKALGGAAKSMLSTVVKALPAINIAIYAIDCLKVLFSTARVREILNVPSNFEVNAGMQITAAVVSLIDSLLMGLLDITGLMGTIVKLIYGIFDAEGAERISDAQNKQSSEYDNFIKTNNLDASKFTLDMYNDKVNRSWYEAPFEASIDEYKVGGSKYAKYAAAPGTTVIENTTNNFNVASVGEYGSGGRGPSTSYMPKSKLSEILGNAANIINKNKYRYNNVKAVTESDVDAMNISSGANKTSKEKSFLSKAWDGVKSGAAGVWSFFKSIFTNGSGGRGYEDPDYYNQADPKWANNNFGMYNGHRDTVKDGGCGPTVAAMAIQKILNGRGEVKITPDLMSNMALQSGYKKDNDGTDPEFFNYAGSKFGINFNQTKGLSNNAINAMANNKPVVLMGHDTNGTSPYGPGVHYVLGTGIDRNGNVRVLDPQNKNNNRRSFNIHDLAKSTYRSIIPNARGSRSLFGRSNNGFDDLIEWIVTNCAGTPTAFNTIPLAINNKTYKNFTFKNSNNYNGLCLQFVSELTTAAGYPARYATPINSAVNAVYKAANDANYKWINLYPKRVDAVVPELSNVPRGAALFLYPKYYNANGDDTQKYGHTVMWIGNTEIDGQTYNIIHSYPNPQIDRLERILNGNSKYEYAGWGMLSESAPGNSESKNISPELYQYSTTNNKPQTSNNESQSSAWNNTGSQYTGWNTTTAGLSKPHDAISNTENLKSPWSRLTSSLANLVAANPLSPIIEKLSTMFALESEDDNSSHKHSTSGNHPMSGQLYPNSSNSSSMTMKDLAGNMTAQNLYSQASSLYPQNWEEDYYTKFVQYGNNNNNSSVSNNEKVGFVWKENAPKKLSNAVANEAYEYLSSLGYTTSSIAAILGNFQHESGMDPNRKQGHDKGDPEVAAWIAARNAELSTKNAFSDWPKGHAFGIYQLDHDFNDDYFKFLQTHDGGIENLRNQLDFGFNNNGNPFFNQNMWRSKEFYGRPETDMKNALNSMSVNSADDLRLKTQYFERVGEAPADWRQSIDSRYNSAQKYYDELVSNGADPRGRGRFNATSLSRSDYNKYKKLENAKITAPKQNSQYISVAQKSDLQNNSDVLVLLKSILYYLEDIANSNRDISNKATSVANGSSNSIITIPSPQKEVKDTSSKQKLDLLNSIIRI